MNEIDDSKFINQERIYKEEKPAGMVEWQAKCALSAIGLTDDFFAVFPSEFSSVKILIDFNKQNNGLLLWQSELMGRELVNAIFTAMSSCGVSVMEFFLRAVGYLKGGVTTKDKNIDLTRVQCDVLRADIGEDDDFDACQNVASKLFYRHGIIAREMIRYYFDLKYETIYSIYRDCCPNPCRYFFIFDNNAIWKPGHSWRIFAHSKHFKNIKTKKF